MSEEDVAKQISTGLFEFLKPIVVECDARLEDVFQAQNELSRQIDRLSSGFSLSFSVSPFLND